MYYDKPYSAPCFSPNWEYGTEIQFSVDGNFNINKHEKLIKKKRQNFAPLKLMIIVLFQKGELILSFWHTSGKHSFEIVKWLAFITGVQMLENHQFPMRYSDLRNWILPGQSIKNRFCKGGKPTRFLFAEEHKFVSFPLFFFFLPNLVIVFFFFFLLFIVFFSLLWIETGTLDCKDLTASWNNTPAVQIFKCSFT